jgi:hypothetical protein
LRKVEKWASKPDALALDLLRFFELLWWSTSDLWSELYRVREKRIGWVIRISEQFYTDSAANKAHGNRITGSGHEPSAGG